MSKMCDRIVRIMLLSKEKKSGIEVKLKIKRKKSYTSIKIFVKTFLHDYLYSFIYTSLLVKAEKHSPSKILFPKLF